MIEIKNLRFEKPQHMYDIIVDRSSPLGNPFPMYSEMERDEVCDKYERWFNDAVEREDERVINELYRIIKTFLIFGQVRLFCWCYPKRCHAQTIKKYVENKLKEN